MKREFLDYEETAKLLGKSASFVKKLTASGLLPFARLGHRTVIIRRQDVERMFERMKAEG